MRTPIIYMQYLGGKSRISKYISEVINEVSRWKVENSSQNCGCNFERERERVIVS